MFEVPEFDLLKQNFLSYNELYLTNKSAAIYNYFIRGIRGKVVGNLPVINSTKKTSSDFISL